MSSSNTTSPPRQPPPKLAETCSAQTLVIPSLPNDISTNILASIPRCHYPTLSVISKAFHSLLSSPLFFTTRSLINSTQISLFMTLQTLDHPFTQQLFILQNCCLLSLPPIPCCYEGSGYAALGPHIYVVGGSRGGIATTDVRIFDCRFNKWVSGPSIHVARQYPMVMVVDKRLFVIGGCREGENLTEVYDPNAGIWVFEAVIDEVVDDIGFEWKEWECVNSEWQPESITLINGVQYRSCKDGWLLGFDMEEGVGKEVKGVEEKFVNGFQVVNFQGNLVVAWKTNNDDMEIHWMGINVHKDDKGELCGKICWEETVSSFPRMRLINCFAIDF